MFNPLKSIDFERPSLIFSAGEKIRGSLVFEQVEKSVRIYDFNVLLTGVVRQSGNYRPYVENKRHAFDYACNFLRIYSQTKLTKEDEFTSIPKGSQVEIPFEVDLPETLWSTFIGGLGYTVYRLVIYGRPNSPLYLKESALCLREIVIIGLVNAKPDEFSVPSNETKVFTSKSGGLAKLSVSLAKSCASPGDMISFSVLIENGLRLPLGSVKMVFQQNVSYAFGCTKLFSKQMQDQEIVVLQQEEGPLIPPGPKRVISWACNFKVPHSPPSNLGAAGCNLIKLTYCIIVTVAKFVNLQIVVPIHVGTPVRDDTVNWEEVSLAYGAHLRRSLSEHSLAAWTTSDTSSSSWSLMDSGDDADRTACASSTQG